MANIHVVVVVVLVVLVLLLLLQTMQPENDRVYQDAGRRLAGDGDARAPLLITTLPHPFAVLVQK
ncbi:hypothetical protein LY76DRAFT_597435 [Colletotrichum caudatum]|nr:hypothetical protein LY76DRAFT_597435 [Colletotrichum caudatum]